MKKSYDDKYTKGTEVLKKRKLGLVFYKPNGRSAYKITKRLQVLDVKTNKVKSVWFAQTLNRIGYFLDPNRGYDTEASGLYETFGWQVQGDIMEAIEND
jgi:hypothetical protein